MIILSYTNDNGRQFENVMIGVASNAKSSEEMIWKHFRPWNVKKVEDNLVYFSVWTEDNVYFVKKIHCFLDVALEMDL